MKESVGILYDNISGNTGDVAIGLSIKKILKDIGIGFDELIPGRFNPNNYDTIIIGGGHLIRPSPDFFYDKFKINGQHILNAVGIVGSPDDLDYLNDYKYITVRSSWDKEQLYYLNKEVHVVPCTTMLLEDLENIPVLPKLLRSFLGAVCSVSPWLCFQLRPVQSCICAQFSPQLG